MDSGGILLVVVLRVYICRMGSSSQLLDPIEY